ncbi:chaperonin 10-like protein, partial [Fusarium solani]
MANNELMKAVIFDGPFKVSVQDRPLPKLQDSRDIIIKVTATALCGSELHVYRGHEPSTPGFIMGHEFTGIVTHTGEDVETVQIGDQVIVPFTASCMNCFYCRQGWTSRCASSLPFGSPLLDGGQAQYVRVPYADGTVLKSPTGVPQETLVLMGDIFPTGFFGAKNAFKMLDGMDHSDATVVVIGCGPVGLCAIISALEYKPKHLFAIDGVESRLELAKTLGAEPLNYVKDHDTMMQKIMDVSEGRGADAVIEVVGLSKALRTAYDIIRPWGVISSIGVHNAEIPWTGTEAYDKNLRIQMGRCPVRAVFKEALEVLTCNHQKLNFMFEKIMPLTEAVEAYEIFDKMKVQKVIFNPNE